MTQNEIIEMAREAGDILNKEWLIRFAKLVAAKEQKKWQDQTAVEIHEAVFEEREACAKLCDELPAPNVYSDSDKGMWDITSLACGDAIRTRGEA